jgi:hypothetical protein
MECLLRGTPRVLIQDRRLSSLKGKLHLNFLVRISKNTEISNFMKIHPVGAELFRANKRDVVKLKVVFGNSANASKNSWNRAAMT